MCPVQASTSQQPRRRKRRPGRTPELETQETTAHQHDVVPVVEGFDYGRLDSETAQQLRSHARHIKKKLCNTVQAIIEAGKELLAVKDMLPHGQFGRWLRGEFGWTPRTAQNLMRVAESFADECETVSQLNIRPSAIYLLAAPSTPDEARTQALKLAEKGEDVTPAVVKDILGRTKKNGSQPAKPITAEDLCARLETVLKRIRERCPPNGCQALAQRLHEIAAAWERGARRQKALNSSASDEQEGSPEEE